MLFTGSGMEGCRASGILPKRTKSEYVETINAQDLRRAVEKARMIDEQMDDK